MHKLTLKDKLISLTKNSKAKNSNFLVSSIIIDKNGKEYKGVNIEYSIPTNSICAERNALSNALSTSLNFGDLKEIHIFGRKLIKPNKKYFVFPCGSCRQAIYEASNGEAIIFLYNMNDEIKEYSIKELLPDAFTGEEI